jgi:hypothetical protein
MPLTEHRRVYYCHLPNRGESLSATYRIEEGLPLPTEQSLNRKESLGEEGEEREEREGSKPDS